MNILISCAGKQVGLISFFKNELQFGTIIAADQQKFAPSLSVADIGLISPPLSSSSYKNWFLNICKRFKLNLAISLYEPELIFLENLRNEIEATGCIFVGCPSDIILNVSDKWLAQNFFQKHGLHYPQTWILSDFNIIDESPFIIKPRLGRGSRGIFKVSKSEHVLDIRRTIENPNDFIVQPLLDGEHYCFDVVNDLSRNFSTSLIRKKIKIGAEEAEIVTTINDAEIENTAKTLSLIFRHQGIIDIDVVKHAGKIYILDVNFRFGGSYAFSHAAGANVPAALLAWAQGNNANPDWLLQAPGITSSKFNMVQKTKNGDLLNADW